MILKAVCLSFDLVLKLIQKFFPTMEQKLVQRCETEVVADACNASYLYKADPYTKDTHGASVFKI